jgi:hypothetical protein
MIYLLREIPQSAVLKRFAQCISPFRLETSQHRPSHPRARGTPKNDTYNVPAKLGQKAKM